MENMENLLNYTPTQWTIVLSVLTLGYAAMASGLVYFFMTRDRAAPKYRLSSTLSAVVMISAFLELFRLAQNWINSFAFTGQFWEQSGSIFSNGFRYMNWSIDVPVLLTQILIVMGVTGRRFKSAWAKFVIAGLGMIWTGYIGQFYETAFVYDGISLAPYWIWGIISTIFFIYILFLVWKEIPRNFHYLPEPAVGMMKAVRWLLTISWFLYPIAYLIPVVWFDAWGVVARQIIFTVADVTSKVIYGVMLTLAARQARRNRAEDLEGAADRLDLPGDDLRLRVLDGGAHVGLEVRIVVAGEVGGATPGILGQEVGDAAHLAIRPRRAPHQQHVALARLLADLLPQLLARGVALNAEDAGRLHTGGGVAADVDGRAGAAAGEARVGIPGRLGRVHAHLHADGVDAAGLLQVVEGRGDAALEKGREIDFHVDDLHGASSDCRLPAAVGRGGGNLPGSEGLGSRWPIT